MKRWIFLLLAIICIVLIIPRGKRVEFPNGTYVNGTDISHLSVEDAQYELEMHDADKEFFLLCGQDVIPVRHVNYFATLSYVKDLQDLLANIKYIPFQSISNEYTPKVFVNKALFNECIYEAVETYNQTRNPAGQPYIVYENSRFSIMEGTPSEKIDAEKVIDKALPMLLDNKFAVNIDDCLEDGYDGNEDILTPEMKNWNEYTEQSIDMGGGAIETLTKADILPWMIFQDNALSLDTEQIMTYVNTLAERYDTFCRQRTFVTHDGQTLLVGGGRKDTFGYQMNREKTVENIRQAILNGTPIQIAWTLTGRERKPENDFGTTYAEVDLAQQHMWLYKDGECILDSDIVSGQQGPRETTKGVYMILDKQSPAVLRGADYATHVTYWMPFTWTGTGFHDATWRGNFGGNIWTYNGSHGCCNMPFAKAKELFGLIETMTPVIVY